MVVLIQLHANNHQIKKKHLVYVVSDISMPFWKIMSQGIKSKASEFGYSVEILTAKNSRKLEIKNFSKATSKGTLGIILSPINSNSAVFLFKLATNKNIPVVLADIGANSDDYVSYISSNNFEGAYSIGKILAKRMKKKDFDGDVAIIAIPQKRVNGQARTQGFIKALKEEGIRSVGLEQQVDFSYEETYLLSKKLIKKNQNLKALWLQGSSRYQAALDAIKDSDKEDEVLLICFDSEPEFISMIKKETLLASAMQQPFLMGEKAVEQMHKKLQGESVEKNIEVDILAICKDNIDQQIEVIKRNVLGLSQSK